MCVESNQSKQKGMACALVVCAEFQQAVFFVFILFCFRNVSNNNIAVWYVSMGSRSAGLFWFSYLLCLVTFLKERSQCLLWLLLREGILRKLY